MTWPHPVVCVASVLSNAFRRRANQSDVAVCVVDKHVKFVAIVEAFDFVLIPVNISISVFSVNFVLSRLYRLSALILTHFVCNVCKDAVCDVIDANKETYLKAFDVHFLVFT